MASTSQENSKNLIRDFVRELWNTGNLGAADKYLSASHVEYCAIHNGREGVNSVSGWVGIREFVCAFHAGFPDIRFHILQIVAEGENVAIHFLGAGTHLGEFMGLGATGRPVDVVGVAIYRVVDEQVVASCHVVDTMALRRQLSDAASDCARRIGGRDREGINGDGGLILAALG